MSASVVWECLEQEIFLIGLAKEVSEEGNTRSEDIGLEREVMVIDRAGRKIYILSEV